VTPSDVVVHESPVEGLGLFANRAFAPHELIHRVVFEREVTVDSPLRADLGERVEHCAYPDGKVMLVASPYRHMNHSCDPNAYYEYDGVVPIARARRVIAKGDEITVDYLINNPGGDSWPCRCGAERCRGETGVSFFDLPDAIRREYALLLAPWFRQRFAERLRALESSKQ
jgi:histone-lysine N-methyltransferase SETD2